MDKNTVDKIVKAIMSFLGKNAPAELAKPVAPIVVKIELKQVTKDDILMGRDKLYPNDYTQEVSQNVDKLIIAINKIQEAYGKEFKVNSGWRPAALNATVAGAAAHSKHTEGLAADISDVDGSIMRWTLANLELMKEMGIHMEDWRWTPTWTHYQIVPPKSGNRIFIPSTEPALAANRWIGKYPAKFN